MPEMEDKVRLVREYCDRHGIRQGGLVPKPGLNPKMVAPFLIQVDGGINDKTALQCIEAGANVLVSGNYLFEQKDLAKGIESLRHNR